MAANVQSMCQFWKTFDLQDLQKELDTTATDLANKQDESDISRKRLVEQSRDFKKNTPEDIRKVVAPLLKSFQAEVDSLSKRSKSAEAAFLSVYKKLIDLPDPVSALEYALQIQKKAHRVQDLEIENKQLRETLEEYNHEFAEVKNQEVTIKQLKEKLKEHEEKLESTAESRAKEKERELQRNFAEKERQLQETQLAVAKKLGEAEQKISSLQVALETLQSELFEAKAKHDETSTAKSDEMEMVMADLERANERAAAAEREVEQLRMQYMSATKNQTEEEQNQQSTNMEQAIDILKRSNLEVELAAKEKEIAQLVEDVQRLQASLNKLRESTASQVAALEEELSAKNKAFHILEEKLRSQEDYEEVKRELNVLKSIEFSSGSKEEGKGKSLEVLLLEKNKALQSENTTLKVNNTEISGTTSSPSSPTNSNPGTFASPSNEDAIQSTNTLSSSKPSTPSSNGIHSETPPVNHLPFSPDVRFPAPMAFFPFPGSPMHPSFMPINMIKNESPLSSSGALDTSYVAKTVREILSVHNIGQRLFAKHVLGLSQGTVSELLSKPKSWDKLTEKGRESYRKMHAWAIDERNVLALKAISPKRGSQPLVSSVPKEDTATEERIAHILSEAHQAMNIKKSIEQQQVANAVVSSIYQQELSRMVGSNHSQHSSPTTPVSSVASKVHSTTAKMSVSDRISRNSVSSQESEASAEEMVSRIYRQELEKLAKAAESAGNIAASSMYQQELSRLAHSYSQIKLQSNGFSDSHNAFEKNDWNIKSEPPDSTSDDMCNNNGPIDLSKHSSSPSSPSGETNDSSRHSGSAFNLVRPRLNGQDASENNPRYPYSAESLSPLQRMQNIANSLTSRPQIGMPPTKPLRAVLPPITQEEFDNYSNVNTDDLVKKVKETLSQYSISQRLFGETVLGLSQGSVSDLLARPKPWHMLTQKGREPFIRMQLFLEDAEAVPKLVASQYRIAPDKLIRNQGRQDEHPSEPPSSDKSSKPLPPVPTLPPAVAQPTDALAHEHRNWGATTFPSSMLEVIAMTSEIDTLDLTSRVKDVLQFHNLGQKLFGEAVLGLSQGSVSELLSKPKPWHMLSIKGREPFIKMHLWLSDPQNIDRLKHYQSQIKAHRRRKGSLDDRYFESPSQPKRPRVFFNEDQKDVLRLAYTQDPYPNQSTIEALASDLGVGVKTVINWFHNHRMRAKQQHHAGGGNTVQQNGNSDNAIKTEPQDESSNQSEGSSLSGENARHLSGGSSGGGSFGRKETQQWMFPQFEPVKRSRQKNSSGEDEPMSENEDMNTQSLTEEDGCGSDGDADGEDEIDGDKPRNQPDNFESNADVRTNPAPQASGVNKRKRSNPQWVYEGTQLDKTQARVPKGNGVVKENSSGENTEPEEIANKEVGEQEEFEGNENEDGESDSELICERVKKIEKLQKGVEGVSEKWDDVDRGANINKLEKNIENDSSEDWEF